MNFKTYLDIIKEGGYKESPLADGFLVEATEANDQIKRYDNYKKEGAIAKEIERLEHKRNRAIWKAIEASEMYPPDSDHFKMILKLFKKRNRREYQGFLKEYKIMKRQVKREGGGSLPIMMSPVEKRVNERWEAAMKKQGGLK